MQCMPFSFFSGLAGSAVRGSIRADVQARDDLTVAAGPDVTVTNVTDDFGMLVVAGPWMITVITNFMRQVFTSIPFMAG